MDYKLFKELLQVAVGVRSSLSCVPTAKDWVDMYNIANAQTVAGIAFYGVHRLYQDNKDHLSLMPVGLKMKWLALHESIKIQNKVVNGAINKLLKDAALADCHKVIL